MEQQLTHIHLLLLSTIIVIFIIYIISKYNNHSAYTNKTTNLINNHNIKQIHSTSINSLLSPLNNIFDEILYQTPTAINRRGFDISTPNKCKIITNNIIPNNCIKLVGPVINFHQNFDKNNGTEHNTSNQLGWRQYYKENYLLQPC